VKLHGQTEETEEKIGYRKSSYEHISNRLETSTHGEYKENDTVSHNSDSNNDRVDKDDYDSEGGTLEDVYVLIEGRVPQHLIVKVHQVLDGQVAGEHAQRQTVEEFKILFRHPQVSVRDN